MTTISGLKDVSAASGRAVADGLVPVRNRSVRVRAGVRRRRRGRRIVSSNSFTVTGINTADDSLGPLSSATLTSGHGITTAEANSDVAVVDSRSVPFAPWQRSAWPTGPGTCHRNCPAGSSSEWRSPAPWSPRQLSRAPGPADRRREGRPPQRRVRRPPGRPRRDARPAGPIRQPRTAPSAKPQPVRHGLSATLLAVSSVLHASATTLRSRASTRGGPQQCLPAKSPTPSL